MDLRRISTPLTQAQKLAVVPLAEVKLAARISHADEDSMLQDDIEAAFDFLHGPEGWLNGCCLLEEEWEAFLPSDFGRWFEVPLRPLVGGALTSFDVLQSDASYSAVDPAVFALLTRDGIASVQRASARAWPYFGDPAALAYRVRFKAGFGATRDAVPSVLRKAVRMLAAHWFVNRETVGAEGRKVGEDIRYGLRALAGRYRVSPDHS